MVKIKITEAEYPNEEEYVGGIYEAFKISCGDGLVHYAAYVSDEMILWVLEKNCEVIESEKTQAVEVNEHQPSAPTPQILMVEDGSVDIDDLEEWCADNSIKLIVYRQGANKPEFLKY